MQNGEEPYNIVVYCKKEAWINQFAYFRIYEKDLLSRHEKY